MPPKLQVTFYLAMLVVLQTNLVTCHLFPVVMTSFNTAASQLLSRATHKHASNNLPRPV